VYRVAHYFNYVSIYEADLPTLQSCCKIAAKATPWQLAFTTLPGTTGTSELMILLRKPEDSFYETAL
jgi:hypothetical protein